MYLIKHAFRKNDLGERIDLYDEAHGKYIVNRDVLSVIQEHAVIMHPLPQLVEVRLIIT